jgi:DNA-binding IclR family transcriptional regulator
LTETLAALGYLTFLPRSGRYELGAAVVALSHSLLAGMPHRIAARPFLQEIAEATRLPTSIGMREGREIVLIETARHPEARPARFDLGARVPIATSAMGRAWLFGHAPEMRTRLLEALRAEFSAEAWIAIRARIEEAFVSMRERGFCASLGDRRPDVYAVGAPVLTAEGTVLALTCGGLPSEVSAEQLENDIGPRLALAARQLSTETPIDA